MLNVTSADGPVKGNYNYVIGNEFIETQKELVRGRWVTEADSNSMRESGLLFSAGSLDELMRGIFRVSVWTIGSSKTLFITSPDAINYYAYGFPVFQRETEHIKITPFEVGLIDDGTARTVYVAQVKDYVKARAGFTLHDGNGTWSSFPAHKFENEALLAPTEISFEEKFAYVTAPKGGWGIQTIVQREKSPRLLPVRDRDIQTIPLSSHPVTAGPGVRLGYFWVYATLGDISTMEKFTDHGRV